METFTRQFQTLVLKVHMLRTNGILTCTLRLFPILPITM